MCVSYMRCNESQHIRNAGFFLKMAEGGLGALSVTICRLTENDVEKISLMLSLFLFPASNSLNSNFQAIHVCPRLAVGRPKLHEGSAVSFITSTTGRTV